MVSSENKRIKNIIIFNLINNMWKLLFIFILLLILLMIFPANKSTIEESFTTPVALHVPTGTNQDGKPFFIGNLENKMDASSIEEIN